MAAALMGLSAQHLRLLLKQGKVKGKKLDGTWVVLALNYTRKRKDKGAVEAHRSPVTLNEHLGNGPSLSPVEGEFPHGFLS